MKKNEKEKAGVNNEIGRLGEKIAARHLVSKGHIIIEMNYRRGYGEIDIISERDGITYFSEVKSMSYSGVSRGTGQRPEENVHPGKLERLRRVISAYIESKLVDDWEFLVIAVDLETRTKKAYVREINEVL